MFRRYNIVFYKNRWRSARRSDFVRRNEEDVEHVFKKSLFPNGVRLSTQREQTIFSGGADLPGTLRTVLLVRTSEKIDGEQCAPPQTTERCTIVLIVEVSRKTGSI